MSEARRVVRATVSFFEDLDRQLPAERGREGQPSAHDFQVFELIRIVDHIATAFDELPKLIQGGMAAPAPGPVSRRPASSVGVERR